MNQLGKRIMIVTGEASGDLHGANLIGAARALCPDIRFFGAGGRRMLEAGCEILVPGEDLSVMGIAEVVGHFPTIWRAFQRLKAELLGARRPDALVLIDFPDFNLRLAAQAARAGVPVLYYVSPQVWAWRRGRVKKIAAVVDALAAIFPFEPAYYDGLDIRAEYVGHPLLDEFAGRPEPVDLRRALAIPADAQVVGLFPGSRRNELRYMLETLVAAAGLIRDRRPDVRFVVPVADSLSPGEICGAFPAGFPVDFVGSERAGIYDVAECCNTVLSVSGTVTLQVALTGTPMAIFYKLSPFSYAIGKRLIKVDHIGLPNIVAGERVVPELIQEAATPDALANEALRVLDDAAYAQSVRTGLAGVRTRLGEPGCSQRVARMLCELCQAKEGAD